MSKTYTYEFFKASKGRDLLIDLSISGRPSTTSNNENCDIIKILVKSMSVPEFIKKMIMSLKSIHNTVTDILDMKFMSAELLSKKHNFVEKKKKNTER